VAAIAVNRPCAAGTTDKIDDQKGIPVAGSQPSRFPIFLNHFEQLLTTQRLKTTSAAISFRLNIYMCADFSLYTAAAARACR
jgi:hypothetical protein